MLTEADILAALRDCYDPALPCNIVDLGLVRRVTVERDREAPGFNIRGVPQKHTVHLVLALTKVDEAAEAQLRAQIANRLAGMETVGQTTIAVDEMSPWTPQQITPAGRRILGLEGNPTLVQIR